MKKLNTKDNIYTSEENNVIKWYKFWALIGPIVGFITGVIFLIAIRVLFNI